MKVWPQSGRKWFALVLVPFKVFVPCGFLMEVVQREIAGRRNDTGEVASFVLLGYLLSFFCLVLGAMVQITMGDRRAYLNTCGFIMALFVFVWFMLPYLAQP